MYSFLICVRERCSTIVAAVYFLSFLGLLSVPFFTGSIFYGVRTAPYWKYVWNEYLLKKAYADLHSDWLLYIIHGFIGQSSILSVLFWKIVTSCLYQYS